MTKKKTVDYSGFLSTPTDRYIERKASERLKSQGYIYRDQETGKFITKQDSYQRYHPRDAQGHFISRRTAEPQAVRPAPIPEYVPPERALVPSTTVVTRERVRGTRQAVIVKHIIAGDAQEAESRMAGQYESGGNYVLKTVRTSTDYYDDYLTEETVEMGDDGSADES